MNISASRCLYIKLGEGNRWADLAIETGTLRFGFRDVAHDYARAAAQNADFTGVKEYYETERAASKGTATRFSNEVREFYTAATDVLWITFAKGRMWWCFANSEVYPLPDEDSETMGSRYRQTISGWSDKDRLGETLWVNKLRGSLTTTAGFRGTICKVQESDYLLRRLNGQETEATTAVLAARLQLINALVPLIRALHWKDFELLVELVMTQGGWRRVSATGGTQHTLDLELELPLTGERALVQVKSSLDQPAANDVASSLVDAAGGARIFIVYHTSPSELSSDQENVALIGPNALAEHVVDLGLTTWITAKVG